MYISEILGVTIKLTKSLNALAPGIFRAVYYSANGYSQASTKKNFRLIVHKSLKKKIKPEWCKILILAFLSSLVSIVIGVRQHIRILEYML